MKAIISVYDKTNVDLVGSTLKEHNYEILSTGGTARLLDSQGIETTKISDYTGFPEILNGRVKTLHPKIYGGLLNVGDNEDHQQELEDNEIENIDEENRCANNYSFFFLVFHPPKTLFFSLERLTAHEHLPLLFFYTRPTKLKPHTQ